MSTLAIVAIVISCILVYVFGIILIMNVTDKLEEEKLIKIDNDSEGFWIFCMFIWPIVLVVAPFIWMFNEISKAAANAAVWIVKEKKNPRENV